MLQDLSLFKGAKLLFKGANSLFMTSDRRTDGQTDGRTDGRTDKVRYRGACYAHKKVFAASLLGNPNWFILRISTHMYMHITF